MTSRLKQQMRHNFNTVPKTYDVASDWQKSVGDILLTYLNEIAPQNKTILDLGSGTGYLARHIQQNHPSNPLIAVDIAENMLQFSQQHFNTNELICADAENLALKDHSINIIVSNMVLHWCHSLTGALKEACRVLSSSGVLIFSIMGPQSLLSLKNAWKQVDQYTHVNPFPEATTIRQACEEAGLSIQRFERHDIKKYYANIYELMHHLKATGAKNVTANKPKGLTGKQKMKRLSEQYKNPLNYEVFTLVCQK